MRYLIPLLFVALFAGPVVGLLFGTGPGAGLFAPAPDPVEVPAELTTAKPLPLAPAPAPAFRDSAEEAVFDRAARRAWSYVVSQTQPETGLINSVAGYPYATVWDLASGLAAIHSARALGLIGEPEHDRRMRQALETVATMALFDRAALNKNYQVAAARPAGRDDRRYTPRPDGYGWSAIDLGRLLVWLRIVARSDPELAPLATRIVERMELSRIVDDGYLHGESLDRNGRQRRYQEGRIGYEQYAAAGFALWGMRAERALQWGKNVREVEVLGVPVLTDRRDGAYLTSEPFLLIGLELGWWDPAWRTQAEHLLEAQERRFQRTGTLTVVSEDALPVAPDFFYYYTVFDEGEPFAIRSPASGSRARAPRWVSTKAAFGWYALMPGPYSWRAVEEVSRRAVGSGPGWDSGFYEETERATGSPNVNTAALVLEAAVFRRDRVPFLSAAGRR